MRVLLTFLLACFSIALLSCGSNSIEPKKFIGYSKIDYGNNAYIAWDFPDVDSVKISGSNWLFGNRDMFTESPKESRSYIVTAFSGEDSLRLNSYVEVVSPSTRTPKTGPDVDDPNLSMMFDETSFARGIAKYDSLNTRLSSIKIIRTKINRENNSLNARFLLLDQFGNHYEGIRFADKEPILKYRTKCSSFRNEPKKVIASESRWSSVEGIDIGICMDNSASISEYSDSLLSSVKNGVNYLHANDNLHFSYFNQNYVEEISLSSKEYSLKAIKSLRLPAPSGLNGLMRALYKSMQDIQRGGSDNKSLILITSNNGNSGNFVFSDNSSIQFTQEDVVKYAIDNSIALYIIGLGSALTNFPLQYLSSITGGRYYSIEANKATNEISNVVEEIIISQKHYYDIDLEISSKYIDCKNLKVILSASNAISNVSDSLTIYNQVLSSGMQYQSIALFDNKDTKVKPEYIELLQSLAKLLIENPTKKIQLIGHGGIEGSEKQVMKLSLDRAMEVKSKLIAMGVNENNIKVRSDGASKPIYYVQHSPWQAEMNRRVELKWLDSEVLPYEIITVLKATEESANSDVLDWEKKGFKAYYERYFLNNSPYYRIKLWGYSTEDSAKKEAKTLKKTYKSEFEVE